MATQPVTVLGKPVLKRYDQVLAHEHLRIDIRCWFDPRSALTAELEDVRVTASTATQVQQHPFACLDNLVLDDEDLIAGELRALDGRGKTLIVDVTPENVGRDVGYMRRVSRASGVDVVYGCGLYTGDSRPDEPVRDPEVYRRAIVEQFTGAGSRPAVIGEIGTGDPITELERASLIGAVRAQSDTGAPLYVHLHPWAQRGHEVLDLVEAEGGDLRRIVLCHLDVQIPRGLEYHRALLDRGATIAFDIWGDEFAYGGAGMPTDSERVEATRALIEAGYGAQLVHSHDVCTKTQLGRYGGAGFAHLPTRVRPALAEAGLAADEVARQLSVNALTLIHGGREEGAFVG